MIRNLITRAAIEWCAHRGFFLFTREQTYRLMRDSHRSSDLAAKAIGELEKARRAADEHLRRAEGAEAKVEAYERDAFADVARARRVG
jgi:hypothetical protein